MGALKLSDLAPVGVASPEKLARIYEDTATEFADAFGAANGGREVQVLLVQMQQHLQIEKLIALVDELIEAGVVDDARFTARVYRRLRARINELRKPRIAAVVKHAMRRKLLGG